MTIAAIALVVWKPLLIHYHTWGMVRAGSRAFASSPDPNKEAYFPAYDAHLTALVQLDYYEKKVFPFQHLRAGSAESRDLLASLREYNSKLPLADRHTSSMSGYSPPNAHAITIWTKAEHMDELATIIESYDSTDAEAENAQE